MTQETTSGAAEREFGPVEAGEWIRPPLDEPFLMECCDCGLVHALTFDHDAEGRVIFAAERDDESTARQRATRGHVLAPNDLQTLEVIRRRAANDHELAAVSLGPYYRVDVRFLLERIEELSERSRS